MVKHSKQRQKTQRNSLIGTDWHEWNRLMASLYMAALMEPHRIITWFEPGMPLVYTPDQTRGRPIKHKERDNFIKLLSSKGYRLHSFKNLPRCVKQELWDIYITQQLGPGDKHADDNRFDAEERLKCRIRRWAYRTKHA